MLRESRSFEANGRITQIELTIYPDEETQLAFFLREASGNNGGGITAAQRDSIFTSLAEKYEWHNKSGIGPSFYVYNSEVGLWDWYTVGGANGKVSLEFLERCPQYELEYSYDIELARSKSDFIAQGQNDLAYMKGSPVRCRSKIERNKADSI